MIDNTTVDRALGCMVGLAIGDAVGTTVEFSPRGSFPPVTDMVGGGPFRLEAGQWTDDTSMALCLAESLLFNPELDALDLMNRFRRWLELGENSSTGKCFDIGQTTLRAISGFVRSGEPFSGPSGRFDAGNGSIMRLAPVAVRWWHNPEKASEIAKIQSRTTYGAAEAVESCSLLATILCRAISGSDRNLLMPSSLSKWSVSVMKNTLSEWRDKNENDIKSDGYVVNTFEAALWAFYRSSTFEEAILLAVNLGNDSDTVAAVCGQISGAVWGYSGIPKRWREKLYDRVRIEDLARQLLLANNSEFEKLTTLNIQ